MNLNQILSARRNIEKLRILSFEMNIYLVDITMPDYKGLVRNEKGDPQRFHSVTEIKEAFSECRVLYAELVHESPYDEMIGNPPKATNEMVLPIQFNPG